MSKKPLISIIMATHNGYDYLDQAINSVMEQSYDNREFIIIDDASDNNSKTYDLLKSYEKEDNRIVVIKNENNLGLTKSLNKGIRNSKGKYIARIDDDDIWYDNNKIQKQVDFLEYNSEYGMCGTNNILIDKNGNKIGETINRETDMDIRNHLLQSNQFTHTSVLIRKKALDELGFYNEDFPKAQDYNLWLKIGTKRKLHNLQFFGVKYRIHDNTVSARKKFKQKRSSFRNYLQYCSSYPNKIKGFMGQFVKLVFPDFMVNRFVTLNKKIEKLFSK